RFTPSLTMACIAVAPHRKSMKALFPTTPLQGRTPFSYRLHALHRWMLLTRQKITDGSATSKALDYSLRRWAALTRFADDGRLPVDNNHIENQIRPIAIGRSNWLFAGSLRAGKRAAAVMSLIQSARMNGHDPYAYLKDVLARLPTQRASQVAELLPHRWQLSPNQYN
ncbi:IS66 family transposase, partial [Polaromonas hydrogenivorans]|uniref:IS66 family transposase n=1 Tax=Polaromonas hydrogenivorans TaxID=335476 RepID=UPI0039EEB79A